ncbi:AraC family transcriptional regulator [Niabella sp. CC-SYL272]|uniref:helix-turn-helix transcriptional regulator n=1 Tax=Niabella agricola TaxID=2891571 RepID=UPI001F44F4A0|nr:AraC family transcriptional regulator [Niabella agricola]MCF3108228.1 AraC family transcriptional regulator [Niabella agricola]
MAFKLLNTDILDFELLSNLEPGAPNPLREQVTSLHPRAGALQLHTDTFPHIHLSQIQWNTAEDLEMHGATSSDTININFQLGGQMYSRFTGINHPMDMQTNRHNLVYAPEAGDHHHIAGNHSLSLLHVIIDKDFFTASIGCNDRWSEQVHRNLEAQRPFSGAPEARPVSNKMQLLLDSILNCAETGTMRRLLLQSRMLELLALEIEQFCTPLSSAAIPWEEQERLQQLKAYIGIHYLSDLSLHQLSRVSLLNEFKLKKGFKQLFGETLFTYIHRLRMEHAALLLRDTKSTIDEIALVVGYAYAHHFSTAFKKHFKISPLKYRTG